VAWNAAKGSKPAGCCRSGFSAIPGVCGFQQQDYRLKANAIQSEIFLLPSVENRKVSAKKMQFAAA
jgi:hypothetical protein